MMIPHNQYAAEFLKEYRSTEFWHSKCWIKKSNPWSAYLWLKLVVIIYVDTKSDPNFNRIGETTDSKNESTYTC